MMMILSCLLILAIHLACIGLGGGVTRSLPKSEQISSGVESVLKYWVIGVFATLSILYLGSFLYLYWLSFWLILLIGFACLVKFNAVQEVRSFFDRKNLVISLLILTASGCLFYAYSKISLGYQVHGVSGMGNWALKSKLLYMNPSLAEPYFSHATEYGKFSYPPGFPLLNAPLFLINGTGQDVILKLHSTLLFTSLFAFFSYLFVKNWKWYAVPPIILSLGFFLGDAAWTVTYWLYSEPLLLLCCAVSTLLFLRNDTYSSILAAGAASMIKQEGLMFLLIIIITNLMLCRERIKVVKISALTLLPIISWKLVIRWYSIEDSDFHFSLDQFNTGYLKQAFSSVYECVTASWASYSGVFTVLPLLIIYSWKKRNIRIITVIGMALVIIGSYLIVMPFSSVSDIEWHLSATTRYMMLPAVMLAVAFCRVNEV